MNILEKIACRLGFHWWGYQSKGTGIYLHAFSDGTLPRQRAYYTNNRKCWICGKKEKW